VSCFFDSQCNLCYYVNSIAFNYIEAYAIRRDAILTCDQKQIYLQQGNNN